jgi:ribosomal-protein-alanine N-acetyltransferase
MNAIVKCRAVESADIQRICEIEFLTQLTPWSLESLKASIEQVDNVEVIMLDTLLIGFIIGRVVLDEAEILEFSIDPSYQGYGYGKTLLKHLIMLLQEKKIGKIFLEVRHSNRRAMQLYHSIGFREISIRKDYYSTCNESKKEDAVIMQLDLSEWCHGKPKCGAEI